MASAWGSAWANAWGNSWGSVQETVVIIGGDDAPGHDKKRRKRKERHELFSEIETTVHQLLNPQVEELGAGSVSGNASPAGLDEGTGRAASDIDELTLLAQRQHELLRRAAELRAEMERERVRQIAAAKRAIEQDDEDAMMVL